MIVFRIFYSGAFGFDICKCHLVTVILLHLVTVILLLLSCDCHLAAAIL